jgi:hypothetical protein
MSAGICRMPFAAEVHALERKVSRDQRFVSGRNIEDSAIVADSVEHARERSSAIGLRSL